MDINASVKASDGWFKTQEVVGAKLPKAEAPPNVIYRSDCLMALSEEAKAATHQVKDGEETIQEAIISQWDFDWFYTKELPNDVIPENTKPNRDVWDQKLYF